MLLSVRIYYPISCMKSFLFFIAIIALAALGLKNYNTVLRERDALNEKVSTLSSELDALKVKEVKEVKTKPSNVTRIICPTCHGERIIVFPIPGSNDPLKKTAQNCPVCMGKGYKLLTVPEGKKICPDCQGMGLLYSPQRPLVTENCVRCATTGLVISPK